MGSVIEYIECPRCGQENCVNDFYYKSGEEYISCPDCGYYRVFHFKRDTDGKFLREDETKGYEFENLISEEIHIENPYGAYRVETTLGSATSGTLVTEDDYQKFVSEIVSFINQEHNIKEAVVSKLVGDKIEKEIIFQIE